MRGEILVAACKQVDPPPGKHLALHVSPQTESLKDHSLARAKLRNLRD